MNIRICKICGKEFEAEYPNSKYCSFLCKEIGSINNAKAWRENNKVYSTPYMRNYRKMQAIRAQKAAKIEAQA